MTTAVKLLRREIERETLRSFGVEQEVIGTSLLRDQAEKLIRITLGGERVACGDTSQPFHVKQKRISFFCNATDLEKRRPVLLGKASRGQGNIIQPGSYSFLDSLLSSAAFPVLFAPKRESEVLPVRGRTNVFLADGGMFDNLPFLPALSVLRRMQRLHAEHCRNSNPNATDALSLLRQRHAAPDLIIAGSLEERPRLNENPKIKDLYHAVQKSAAIGRNEKISAYARAARIISDQIDTLLDLSPPPSLSDKSINFFDGVVSGAVLQIVPSDSAHLNPAFAFCRTTGLRNDRIQDSISDGCFQTMMSFACGAAKIIPPSLGEPGNKWFDKERIKKSLGGLSDRIPTLVLAELTKSSEDVCPYFKLVEAEGKDFTRIKCPFRSCEIEDQRVRSIWDRCKNDSAHITLHRVAHTFLKRDSMG